ncbi:arylsulfatase [Thalassovita sp.]|uniref:arylsulfatase n=1 Tax=Thalassovita sp. TaxID=1979401 RepID=UPI0029DE81BB|nr:arylsulfatase [Thalassovita sp.]
MGKTGEDGLKSGDPANGWTGKIGKTFRDSEPHWRARVTPPKGAPNILVILLDDLGFAEMSCFGSEIETPNLDRLAAGGLRFNNYTTVPMCAPARAALMTGKNPHSVGAGWLTHADPGYPGFRAAEMSKDAPTIPELLRDAGYATYAVGKWHNTPDAKQSSADDKSSWPLQRGFDRFYGFLGAETNYHAPGQIVEGNEFRDIEEYGPDYFSTDDFARQAIKMLRGHASSAAPDKPFFLYFATNAPHTPHHAKPEDIAKYKGRYDAGWDAIRQERYARQREMGVIGDWELPELSPGVPKWQDMPEGELDIMAAYMEIYAGLVDNIDQNIGRIVDELVRLEKLDNTLILITSDNGASSIGGEDGAANFTEKRVTQTEPPELARELLDRGLLGAVNSSPAYPKGWGNAGNTPFRFFKRTPMNGGIRVPFLLHWPARIKDAGAVRENWAHVTDISPTILDLLGLDYPAAFNGYRTRGQDGVSFLPMLTNGTAPAARSRQYFELEGNRGYIDGKWKIGSLQPPGSEIDLDNWMLFDLATDPTECHDLSKRHPEILERLIHAFDEDAFANYAYPLDNRTLVRALTHSPERLADINRPHKFYPGTEGYQAVKVSPLFADRDYVARLQFDYADGMEGVLFALGDSLKGICAYVIGGKAVLHYNGGVLAKYEVRLPLRPGLQQLVIHHTAPGKLRGQAQVRLEADGETYACGDVEMSPGILMFNGEGLDIGLDRKTKVATECEGRGTFAYSGQIDWLHIDPGPQAPGSMVNQAEIAVQRDW